VCLCSDLFGTFPPLFIVRKQLMKMFDHCRAGTRWTNYRLSVRFLKNLDEPLCELLRFLAVTGIKSRLAAASLAFVKHNFTANATQYLHGAHADIRAKLVNQACNKERDFHDRYCVVEFVEIFTSSKYTSSMEISLSFATLLSQSRHSI
jgi:hypothetical protein